MLQSGGAVVVAATGESERQACERNGGAWDTGAGFCESESKARGKQ